MALTFGLVLAQPAHAVPRVYCVPSFYLQTAYGYARPCTQTLDSGNTRRGLHNRAAGAVSYHAGFLPATNREFNYLQVYDSHFFFTGTAIVDTAYGRASYGIKVHASRVTGQFGWYNMEVNEFMADSGSLPLLITSDDDSP